MSSKKPLLGASALPFVALLFNALVWGVSWWPFRALHQAGLHPLWATALMYAAALVCVLVLRPGTLRSLRQNPALWMLALSSGLTNVAFNWAVTIGDVVRVVLLFYLMPAWSVLLAWKVLDERPTAASLLRLVLGFAGVALVLLPADATAARLLSHLSAVDLLALAGGLFFALTNVTLRRLHAIPGDARMLAMFGGGAVLACGSAAIGWQTGALPGLPALSLDWVPMALGLAAAFLLGNYALQYGAARLAAGTTAIVMLSEVVFASVSSVLLSTATLNAQTLAGGALILAAAGLAAWPQRRARA